jgi:hypothetical protein
LLSELGFGEGLEGNSADCASSIADEPPRPKMAPNIGAAARRKMDFARKLTIIILSDVRQGAGIPGSKAKRQKRRFRGWEESKSFSDGQSQARQSAIRDNKENSIPIDSIPYPGRVEFRPLCAETRFC